MAGYSHAGAQCRGQGRERGRGNRDGAHNRSRSPQTGRKNRSRQGGRSFASDAPRRLSLEVLTKVRTEDAFANLILPGLVSRAHLERRDAAFATALTYGTLRLQGRYDAIIAQCVDRDLANIDGVVLDVLRLGAHQLYGMRVASHAAVAATVDLARDSAGHGAASFVNAVLRRMSRKDLDQWIEEITQRSANADEATAQRYSHPLWITKALRQALVANGRSDSELPALLEADNTDPAIALCARPGLVSPEHLMKEAGSRNPDSQVRQGDISPYAVILPGGDPGRLPSIRAARAGVEDEGSQLLALVLSEAPLEGRDERWLDMCAGPGGKAALLASRAAQRGAHLLASEVAEHRASLVRSALRSIPRQSVQVRCADGREYGQAMPEHFDRVLVDAPCSGLGSLRRRPESRWRRQLTDIAQLGSIQRALLTSAVHTTRVGGLIAYVTCSPHVLETHYVVDDVRRRLAAQGVKTELVHAGDIATRIAPVPPAGAGEEMLQLWPHLDGTDAMFCALLQRLA